MLLYINVNYYNYYHQKTTCMFLHIQKSKQIAKRFYIQKSIHFSKSMTICVTLLYTKIQTLYLTQFLMKSLKLAFIYKKHDTLRYVTFLYTKIQTLRKKQDSFRYVFE